MYYRLEDAYSFRGWKFLPFAIRALYGPDYLDRPRFYSREKFRLLIQCNGIRDISADELSQEQIKLLSGLVQEGILQSSEFPMEPLLPEQQYHIYSGKYLDGLQWSITGKCNYHCRHCLVSAPTGRHPQLSLEKLYMIAEQIRKLGIRAVSITGGEPLVYKDFLKLTEKLTEYHICITEIDTNGSLLTEELLDSLSAQKQHPVFQLSFDGIGHHSWLRGVEQAEAETVKAIQLLRSKGFSYSCAMCIHKENADSLADTVRFLADNGCTKLTLNAPRSFGIWREYETEYALSYQELWDIYRDYLPVFMKEGAPIELQLDGFVNCKPGMTDYEISFDRKRKHNPGLDKIACCENTRYRAYIDAEGRLLPCMAFASNEVLSSGFSSLMTKDLSEATWNSYYSEVSNTTIQQLVDHDSKCRDCVHLLECNGGCLAEGMTETGDYLQHDPMACWFFQHIGLEKMTDYMNQMKILYDSFF